MISAQEAKEIGLVNKVFPADELMVETRKVASQIASKGRVATRAVKYAIDRGMNLDLINACALEMEAFALKLSPEPCGLCVLCERLTDGGKIGKPATSGNWS